MNLIRALIFAFKEYSFIQGYWSLWVARIAIEGVQGHTVSSRFTARLESF